MQKRMLVLFAAAAMLTRAAGQRIQPVALGQEEIVVAHNPDLEETTYKIAVANCTITWTVASSELNREGIGQHSDCALSLREQAPLIAKLLRRVLDTRDAREFHTLYWGRLYPEYPGKSPDATMAVRLGVAAKRSLQWDGAGGLPRDGRMNDWVRDLANAQFPIVERTGRCLPLHQSSLTQGKTKK